MLYNIIILIYFIFVFTGKWQGNSREIAGKYGGGILREILQKIMDAKKKT
jgi:hypothetical protein